MSSDRDRHHVSDVDRLVTPFVASRLAAAFRFVVVVKEPRRTTHDHDDDDFVRLFFEGS